MYIDDLILRLESDRLGCCDSRTYIGCIVYADDILLKSASVASLQSMLMLSICDDYGCKYSILFNCKIFVCVKIGHKWSAANDCLQCGHQVGPGFQMLVYHVCCRPEFASRL